MCLAIPVKILSTEGLEAWIEIQGVRRQISIALIDTPGPGDYVLVHAGFAIQKWSAQDYEEYRRLLEDFLPDDPQAAQSPPDEPGNSEPRKLKGA